MISLPHLSINHSSYSLETPLIQAWKGLSHEVHICKGNPYHISVLTLAVRPEILNQLHIAAACLGNHDFDFGMPQLGKLIRQTNFPWILSNVLDEKDQTADPVIKRYLVMEQEDLRIGIIGLVEKEWIQTIPS